MIKDSDIIKDLLTIEDILTHYGYQINRYNRIPCPVHGGKNKTSFSYNKTHYQCFSCNSRGGVIELVMEIFGLAFKDAINKIISDFSLDIGDSKPAPLNTATVSQKKREKEIENETREHEKAIYLALAKGHAVMMRSGKNPEMLSKLEDWLDENIDIFNK